MPRNTRNINLLLYGILGLCVTVFIFWLLFIPSTIPPISPTPAPTPPVSQSPQKVSPTIPPISTTLAPTPSVSQSPQKVTPADKPNSSNTYSPCIADVPHVPDMLVRYGGSTTFAPLGENTPFHIAIKKAHRKFNLIYTEPPNGKKPGSRTGIEMLLNGQLTFSLSSQGLNGIQDSELQRAMNTGFQLKPEPVAYDGIAIYVNPELIKTHGLQGLTLSQIKDIFTGNIINWKDVAGKNWKNGQSPKIKITPFTRELGASGTVEFFSENVLNQQPFGSNAVKHQDTTSGIRRVARTRGGIGFATASEVINEETIRVLPIAKDDQSPFISPCADDNCTSVNQTAIANNSYPLTRRLFVIVKQGVKDDETAGVAYANMLMSDEGQQFVKDAGLVPIRTTFNATSCQRP